MIESDYTPENPFGVGVTETTSHRFVRKAVAAGGLALGGMTTAYVGSKVGLEVISDPLTIASEGLAVFNAIGAVGAVLNSCTNFIMPNSTIDPPNS